MKQKIKQRLLELADYKYKKFHKSLCPGINNIIGIRVPVLRAYAKKLLNEYDIDELLNNIDNEYYEEIMLQGMLIGLIKNDIDIVKKYLVNFIPKIDNWAICDVFCAGLKITKKYKKEMWQFIMQYLNSKNQYEIRFMVVMILDYYLEKEYLAKCFCIFDSITCKEYYVQMAIAWAISVCLVKFYDETIEYLKNSKIDNFTYNKAIQKAIESYRITEEQKRELRRIQHEIK